MYVAQVSTRKNCLEHARITYVSMFNKPLIYSSHGVMNQTSNDFIQSYERIAVLCFVILVISIGNTMVSRGIWDKYQF